jgi:hypothetical protein
MGHKAGGTTSHRVGCPWIAFRFLIQGLHQSIRPTQPNNAADVNWCPRRNFEIGDWPTRPPGGERTMLRGGPRRWRFGLWHLLFVHGHGHPLTRHI